MKSTRVEKSQAGSLTHRKSMCAVVFSIALSSLVVLPAFAQRGQENRERAGGNERKSEARSPRPESRNESRGQMPQQLNNAPRGNNQQASRQTDRIDNSRRGPAPQRFDNNRAYEGRYDRYYGKWPARGVTVRVLPAGGNWRTYNGVRYMYHNGFYYRPYGSSYVVVAPPLGFRIASLPVGFVAFSIANAAYYYYAGAYYQRYNNEYVVVQPPLGALVQTIPEGGQQVVIDGNTFFIVDGIQYQAVMYNGSIWYKVIKIENRVDNYTGNNPY